MRKDLTEHRGNGVYEKLHTKSLQSRPTLCNPMDCSRPGSSVHGILQARMWGELPCFPPGDLPDSGIKPASPALQTDSLLLSYQGSLEKLLDIINHEHESEIAQSCPTVCNSMDCSLPGSPIHEIFQAIYWSGLSCPPPGDLPGTVQSNI